MVILVTGGAGFIGSHVTDKLLKRGHSVIIIDNLSSGSKKNISPVFFKRGRTAPRAKFYKIDICSSKISRIFRKEKPKAVFHFAAQVNVRESVKNPAKGAQINISGTLNLLESCEKFNVKKIIFASSAGIYGEPKTLPIKESHPLNPISPYAIGKLAAEKYLNFYKSRGPGFVSLRYSNVYGPRQSSRKGGAAAIFIDKILKGKKPTIYGSGEQTRDFVYVDDAAEAAILALRAKNGSIYNIGTGKETKIKDLLRLISLKLKKTAKPNFRPIRKEEITKSKVDFSRIKRELSWQPKYGLEEGLNETIKWFGRKQFSAIKSLAKK